MPETNVTRIVVELTDDEVELLRRLTNAKLDTKEAVGLNLKIANALLDAGYKKKQRPTIY